MRTLLLLTALRFFNNCYPIITNNTVTENHCWDEAGGMRVLLGHGSGVLDPPLPTAFGDLFLAAPINRFILGTIPANGIATFNSPAPAGWVPSQEHPIQALIGRTLSNLDILKVE